MPLPQYTILLLCVSLTTAYATEPGKYSQVEKRSSCPGREVVAAWYQKGRMTASGERFDPSANTAAMRHPVAFGTMIKVTNPRNRQSVVVRINDRGPFVSGVTIDLARGAAASIGMTGTQRVCLENVM